MIRLLICTRCKLVIAVGGPAKKTTCPRCQSPVTARPGLRVETKSQRLEVAA
jgi:RNA polymerase subunit RPABC4/transcription elongation factor Spt4